jgi:hypothetical protein
VSAFAVIAAICGVLWVLALLLTWAIFRMAAISDQRDDQARAELRRRRGSAGWEKPVSPPRSKDCPRGLPPRVREHRS